MKLHRHNIIKVALSSGLLLLGPSAWADASILPAKLDASSCAPPAWTDDTRRLEHEGTVTLGIELGEDGSIRNIVILNSSGFTYLDQATVDSVKQCRFSPATRDEVPIRSRTKYQFVWKLT